MVKRRKQNQSMLNTVNTTMNNRVCFRWGVTEIVLYSNTFFYFKNILKYYIFFSVMAGTVLAQFLSEPVRTHSQPDTSCAMVSHLACAEPGEPVRPLGS